MRLPVLVLLVAAGATSGEPRFYPDDPLVVDDALVDVSEKPAEIELSDLYDRFGHIFKDWGESPIGAEAADVNTLDEVPDGPWFVNRHGKERMSIEALVRGPNQGDGPDPDETWTVFQGKSQGLTPGFQIIDGKGHRYVIKLDPVDVPELASAAEIIATKLLYAIGYHVPQNYIVFVHPDNFAIRPGTVVENRFGDELSLTGWRFREMIREVPRLEDGSMRVTASRYIPGEPIGPFRYHGTRSDDPNDIVPHEDRRELRGLRLIAAWLNHDDTRAHNTQDTWMEIGGRHIVRHYLIDFGSTFGSGSVAMQFANLSYHYWLDFGLVKRNLKSFGFHVPKYRKAEWPEFPEYESVGRWEGDLFDPVEWRNDYPNPAFLRMTARDAFWAAKIIMRFTEEELAAIVETGEYSDPKDAEYFLEVLRKRQLKCGRFGLNVINPLDGFHVWEGALSFENLSEKHGFVEAPTRYRIDWSSFDNETGEKTILREAEVTSVSRSPLPKNSDPALFLLAEIHSLNDENPHWNTAIRVYLRPTGTARYEIVGIDRESPERSTFPME